MFTLRGQNTQFCSRISLCGSMLLLISVISSPSKAEDPATPPAEEIANKTEQTTDADESTQRILPHESPKIDEFYNYKPALLYEWKNVKEAYDVKDIKFLRFFCMKVHELAGGGQVNVINNFIMDRAVIRYKNPMYFPTDTDFLQYVIHPPMNLENIRTEDHFFITEGLKEDCIFYLEPTSKKLSSFEIGNHVCGVNRALKGTTNATTMSPEAAAEIDGAV